MDKNKSKFGSKRDMLETLNQTYLYFVGSAVIHEDRDLGNARLTQKEQKELGRKLAEYWSARTYIK